MDKWNFTFAARILLAGIAPLTLSCVGEKEKAAIDESLEIDPKSNGSIVSGTCYNDQYTPEGNIVRKLDILVVPDTSASIIDERAAIADGFDSFLSALPPEADYRLGVVLGHSPKTEWSGKLYQKGSEPAVLDSQTSSVSELTAQLRQKLENPAGDYYSDGGEMGLYSLLKTFENKEHIQGQGFLREDAALAVIFVADEQDICASFPAGVSPVPDPQGGEERSKNEFCFDGEGKSVVGPQIVLDAIKEHQQDRPFVVGAVLYNNPATVALKGENEIGYGYKETVELAGGVSVDLASGEYGDGLQRLGKIAQVAVKPENAFNLKTAKADPSTIEVLVDGQAAEFTLEPETNQVALVTERPPFSAVNVKYCEKEQKSLVASKVVAGGYHSCAILADGKVKCWGRNHAGQLGLGHTQTIGDDESPAAVEPIDFGQRVVDLASGFYHNCAVLEDGSVKCWGFNGQGQLGQGHKNNLGDDESLADIPPLPLKDKAKKIYAGTFYSCALLENRKVQCWGDNSNGQLGYGDYANRGDDETLDQLPYLNISDVVQMDISTISSHTCAALANGDLKCWGKNDHGQLGYGNTDAVASPADVGGIAFGNSVLQLATGNNHTCALAGGQKIKCWGSNSSGQTGLGAEKTIGDDEAAGKAEYIRLTENDGILFNMAASGNEHVCAVATDNGVYCWGSGAFGANGLGHGRDIGDDEVLSGLNTKVALPVAVSQVAGGISHTCALTKDEGEVVCWGRNIFGQLGLGHTRNMGDDESPNEFARLRPPQE